MNNHRNLLRRHIEQTAGLDHFESFVHQCRGIDGDAIAHLPGRVVERLLHRNIGKFGFRRMQEWSAGSREPDAPDFLHASATKALMDCVVLAVNGKQWLALVPGFGGDKFSRCDQAFFVGQADGFAGANRLVSSFEPGNSHNSAYYKIDLRMSSNVNVSGSAMGDFNVGDPNRFQSRSEVRGMRFGSHRDHSRTPALRLLKCKLDISSGGERYHLKSVGERFDHTESAAADAAGRSQNRNTFHGCSYGTRNLGARFLDYSCCDSSNALNEDVTRASPRPIL